MSTPEPAGSEHIPPERTVAVVYDAGAVAYRQVWAPALHRHTRALLGALPPRADRRGLRGYAPIRGPRDHIALPGGRNHTSWVVTATGREMMLPTGEVGTTASWSSWISSSVAPGASIWTFARTPV